MLDSFLLFVAVGFLAQIVDGALGMAYGLISSTVLLSLGVPPATTSASVHAAELFTTAASAGSHIRQRNVNWALFLRLAPAGVAGGVAGSLLLTSIDGDVIKPFITGYLALMGCYILYRAFRVAPMVDDLRTAVVVPLGAVGGFVDASGGGGWGPVVTSSLLGAGGAPRYVIGTVNTAEFFLTAAISGAFLTALLTGHWSDAGGLMDNAVNIAGLVVGGVVAAPLAAYVVRWIRPRPLMIMVGLLIVCLAGYQTWTYLS